MYANEESRSGILVTLASPFPPTPHARFLTALPSLDINAAAYACGLDEGEEVGAPQEAVPSPRCPQIPH